MFKKIREDFPASSDPDAILMLRFKKGDEEAFRKLFQKYTPRLIRFAYRFVESRARAEELAQDIFIQIYRSRDRYWPAAPFSSWLFRIATNLCLNEVRKGEYREEWESLEGPPAGTSREIQDTRSPEFENLLDGHELENRLKEGIRGLPPKQRAALILGRIEGLSYWEVAQALGCSEGAVKSLIHRATQNLKEKLGDFLSREDMERKPR